MELQEAIRLRIIELMKDNNMNGNKLSLTAGISRSIINKFLRGDTKSLTIETIALICQAINISLKDFFDSKLFIDVEIKD